MYKVKTVEMDGFRGINKSIALELDPKLTLIHGPNGTGKSSILQAIEWGITGSIPYMRGGDFTKEDAVVNAFVRSNKGRVRLTFTGPQELTLTRSKNRTRSTTSGRQNLLLDADKSYQNENAESFIETMLEHEIDEAARSKFLHQETIRDALTYTPAQRSAIIEKLLGTYDIKEFSKALDQKRTLNAEKRNLEGRLDAIQRDRIQFIINLRRDLDESKSKLQQEGYGDHQLEMGYALKELDDLRKNLDEIAAAYEMTIVQPDIAPSIDSLIRANQRISEDITALDRKRMAQMQEVNGKMTRTRLLIDAYINALSNFKEFETLDVDGLTEERDKSLAEIQTVEQEYNEIQKVFTLIPARVSTYNSLRSEITAKQETFENMIKDTGDEIQIQTKIAEIENRLEEISQEMAKYSGHQRVVTQAIDVLEATQPEFCPVCSQTIDSQQVINDLKNNLTSDITEKLESLSEEEKEYRKSTEDHKKYMQTIARERNALKDLENQITQAQKALEELVGPLTDESDLFSISKDLETQVQELRKQIDDLRNHYNELDGKIKQFNHLDQEISDNRKKLQTETNSTLEGNELVKSSEDILIGLSEESKELEKTANIDTTQKRQNALQTILGYLEDKEKTENAEKDLPALEEQKNELEERSHMLALLEGSLSSIQGIVTTYQKESSLRQIQDLEDSMNETYQAIEGHPYFTRLKIDIEKEDPLQFSFRAASEKESTYIPTRFSTAQLNIAALSIFLANSKLLAGGLPLITLDDPTQNMDDYHKAEFARFISTLTDEFQVIISTEDDETRDLLLEHCTDAKCYEITNWSPEGPTIS